eukprot:superscaffoldBa00000975_g8294
MLACLQRRQNPPPQHPVCASKTLEPPQALGRKSLAHRGSFPAGGVPQSHAFPLPSAFCCEHGGRSNLIALGGELEEEGLCVSFGHSRTWVEKQVPGSKAFKLAFGRPRCKASTPSVFACQRVGVGLGMKLLWGTEALIDWRPSPQDASIIIISTSAERRGLCPGGLADSPCFVCPIVN